FAFGAVSQEGLVVDRPAVEQFLGKGEGLAGKAVSDGIVTDLGDDAVGFVEAKSVGHGIFFKAVLKIFASEAERPKSGVADREAGIEFAEIRLLRGNPAQGVEAEPVNGGEAQLGMD